MIKPDMIPKECFVAYQRAFKGGGGVGDAIAAALNAWPGMRIMVDIDTGDDAAIKLPLPKESSDD